MSLQTVFTEPLVMVFYAIGVLIPFLHITKSSHTDDHYNAFSLEELSFLAVYDGRSLPFSCPSFACTKNLAPFLQPPKNMLAPLNMSKLHLPINMQNCPSMKV